MLASREDAITMRSVATEALSKGKKQELVQKKKDELARITTKEATAYAIFYNNAVFLTAFFVLARVVFVATFTPV